MNAQLALFALALVAANAVAAGPQDDALAPTIRIDCQRPQLPSQQAVARLTEVDNFGQAYAMRTRLMADARRACLRNPGVDQVDMTRPQPSRWLAER